ncbi:hypothetical protein OIU74_011718 [Salix koriyanagi]|uniref:Uncharacterized protein n=1 Tax=Salix koriyanagi TaxID=2511006 RepID=A0A9Q0TFX8_9ROSI|nr:hypothetical protein OIU74_011718 [Salix koriyanagi]
MVKKSKKSKSKRITLKQKHKVIRKVKEHHKKKAKEAKKSGLNKKRLVLLRSWSKRKLPEKRGLKKGSWGC